jgi:predicted metal-dependent peptidase
MDIVKDIKKQNIAIMGNKTWVWMGGILCFGKWSVVDDIPTACTDGKNVMYGREFMTKLSEPERRFIILHEAMHKMARHLNIYKQLHTLDAQRANAACDYWINNSLVEQDGRDKFITMPNGGLFNPTYKGKTVIEIFKDLEKQSKQNPQDCMTDKTDGSGNQITQGYPSSGGMDEHDWEGADLSKEELETLAKDIEIAIRQGKQLAGKMSGNRPRVIDEVLAGKVDWKAELAEFLKQVMAGRDESSWSKLNRRMSHMGHFPSAISTTCGRIAVCPDMSGSIGGAILGQFMGEIKKLCIELQPSGVDILWWDTEVCGVQSFEPSQYENLDNLLKPVGGGGTAPQCVADWLGLNKPMNHECVVMLSDGYVDRFPSFDIPVLWAMTTDVVAEHGRTVRMEADYGWNN